jgi:uncharacterized membrane protein
LATLVVGGFVIRWVIATNGGYWRDEALFLFVARSPSWSAMVDFLRVHESHPPLYYALMRLWMTAFGTSDHSILFLPVFLGVVLIPVAFLIGRSAFSARAGLIAAILISVSPPLVEYSALARPYSFLPLLVITSSWLLVLSIESGDWRRWSLYSVTALALLLTHNWAFLVVGGQAVAVVTCLGNASIRRPKLLRESATAFASVALLYMPWMQTLLYQARHAGNDPLDVHGISDVAQLFAFGVVRFTHGTLIGTSDRSGQQLIAVCVIGASALMIIGFYQARRAGRSSIVAPYVNRITAAPDERRAIALRVFTVVPAFAIAGASMLSVRSDLLVDRCISMLAPLILLLIAHWIATRAMTWYAKPGTVFITSAFILVAFGNYAAGLLSLMRPRSDARTIAAAFVSVVRPSDLIIVAPVWLASSFNYYYRGTEEQLDFPAMGRETAVDFSRLWQRVADSTALRHAVERIRAARRENRRVWLVTETRYLRKLTTKETGRAYQPRHFYLMSRLRLLELQAVIASEYGTPKNVLRETKSPGRLEQFTAILFSSEQPEIPR